MILNKVISNKTENQIFGSVFEQYRIASFVQNVCAELHAILSFHEKHLVNPVTVFTSARNEKGSSAYEFNQKLGYSLAQHGFQVLTGGGPGGMEAINRGAKEAGGESFGIDIEVPFENKLNPYLDAHAMAKYFFTRKLGLLLPAVALIVTPGGFGTHDELFEVIHLKDRNPELKMPIILVGQKYYQDLYNRLETAYQKGHIKRPINELIKLIDDPKDIVNYIDANQQPLNTVRKIDINHIYDNLMEQMVKLSQARARYPFTVSIFASTYDDKSWWWPYESITNLSRELTLNGISTMIRASDPFLMAAIEGYEEASKLSEQHPHSLQAPVCLECFEEKAGQTKRTRDELFTFSSSLIFENKLIATRFANLGGIFYPGGAGTLDYFFEILCLKQTFKINVPVPIPAFHAIENRFSLPNGTINDGLNHLQIIDRDGHITTNFQPRNPKLNLEKQKEVPLEAEELIIKALLDSQNIPLILLGEKHWVPYLKYFQDSIIRSGAAKWSDLELFSITNNYGDALTKLLNYRRSLITW